MVETNILVVDDSNFFRDLIRTDLENNGYRVLLAEDGAQALSLYRSHDIHILITDLEMPVMTGLELCWHVRAEDDQHRTFTILMTGDTERPGGSRPSIPAPTSSWPSRSTCRCCAPASAPESASPACTG